MKHLNYQKGIAPIVAIFILAVILIGGGAYYFKQQQAKPATKPVVDATANWKTYQSHQAGFSFQYPSTWKSQDVELDIGGTDRSDANRVWFLRSDSDPIFDFSIEYWTKFEQGITLQDFIEKRKDALTNPIRGVQEVSESLKEENILLDNLSAKKISLVNTARTVGKARFIEVFAQRGERIYYISAEIPFDVQNAVLPIINHILSTFKFIELDANNDAATWKTYTDSKSGLEFKYPPLTKIDQKYTGLSSNAWVYPPIVTAVSSTSSPWSCEEKGRGAGPQYQKEKIIGGNKYCIFDEYDSATGTTLYSTSYTSDRDSKQITLQIKYTFYDCSRLDVSSGGSSVMAKDCASQQANFVDSLPGLMNQIFSSLKFLK